MEKKSFKQIIFKFKKQNEKTVFAIWPAVGRIH